MSNLDQAASGTKQPNVVAVTVSTDDCQWLERCFSSLLSSHLTGVRLSAILVDNASRDSGPELVEACFPTVDVIRRSVRGHFSDANNVGIRRALARGADYIWLVNPDTCSPPNLVQGLVDFMECSLEYGVVGPLQYQYRGCDGGPAELNSWSRIALEAGEANVFVHTSPSHPSSAGPLEGRAPDTLEFAYVQGAALFCRAAVLQEVGLFEEVYGTYYEETDLCRRARWAGWRVALHLGLGIEHHGEGGTAGSRYRRRRMLRNKYYYLLSDPEWSAAEITRLAARWVVDDLARRGAAPAARRFAALGDTLLGVLWVLSHLPAVLRRRAANQRLIRCGGSGPLAACHHPTVHASEAEGPGSE